MDITRLIARLEQFGATLPAMVLGLNDREARWKPPSGAWSVLEIVNHLGDEEVEDFRTRVRMTQEDPAAPWPGIDPVRWARERNYNERDLAESVSRFVRERRASVEWLRSRTAWDWEVSVMRPHGPLRAGDLMVSWAAHDALHMRQIAKRMYELAAGDGASGNYSPLYAGEWSA